MQVIETYWRVPITVRLRDGFEHTFHSVEESLDFLQYGWPGRTGRHHQRALDLCRSAASRMVAVEAAREAFISACLEANITPTFPGARPVAEQPLLSRLQ